MSDYTLSIQEYDVKQFASNNHLSNEYNKEPATVYSNVFCNVVDNNDMNCEEIVVENTLRKSDVTESVNIEYDDDDVICIDDSDDETPYNENIDPVVSEGSFLTLVPEEGGIPIEISNSQLGNVFPSNNNVIEQSITIDEVLCNIGFNLIFCNFNSNKDDVATNSAASHSVDHLNLPLKHCRCGFKSESAFVYDGHVNFLDGVPAKCCLCQNFNARNFKRLSIHMKTVHKVPDHWAEKCPPYQCQFCDHNASTHSAFKKHTRTCMTRFTLNSNLAPRLMEKELHGLTSDMISNPRNVSVIFPNPKNKTSGNNVSDVVSFHPSQQSVIVPNTVGYQNFPSLLECGYCKASIKDLESLGIHMEVMHNIQYSFDSSEFLIEEVPVINVSKENALKEEASKLKTRKEKNLKKRKRTRPLILSSGFAKQNEGEVEVERELAKMTIRKECLWCYRSFESIDLFEEHMVKVHDDLKCDVEGFWLAIQGGLSECFGFEVALSRVCPWCSSSFVSPSSCHRHILNRHWEAHLEACEWCQKVVTLRLPYSLERRKDGSEAVNGDDSSSSSSFMSDIDSKEVVSK